jgi:hypothetical protein
MNVICPNCQTPNDESHRFCSNCATPLAKPVVSPTAPETSNLPPPGPPPMSAPVPSPVSSGQAPAAPGWPSGQAPVRLSPALIIGGVVASIVIVMTISVALATLLKPNPTPNPTPTTGGGFPIPTLAVSTPQPIGNQPTPTPIANPATPAPAGGTPTPSPGGGTGGGGTTTAVQTIDVDNIRVTAPTDWTVNQQKPDHIWLVRPAGGLLILQSYRLIDSVTLQGWIDEEVASIRNTSPDVKFCVDEKDVTVVGKLVGKGFQLCYTVTPTTGAAYRARDTYVVGMDDTNTVYDLDVYAAEDSNSAMLQAVIDSVKWTWKLYQGN